MADTKDDWQEIPLNEVDDWEEVKDSPAQAVLPELPGMLESAGRGAMQGLSFGWADEIQAKTEELLGGENYDKRLAEIREANKLAAETNPISYYGADILSGFALPIGSLGAAAKGVGMLAKAGKAAKAGAVIGGVTGAGTSEGTTGSEVAADALMGGTAGAVAGPLLEGAVGGVKGLMNRTGSKVGAIADVKDFYKYGKEGVELSGPDALRRVTGEGFETVEKELIPQLEKSIKVKNEMFEAGKKASEEAGKSVNIKQLEDMVNKAEAAGVDPKQIEKLRRELSILGKRQEVEVTDPTEYRKLFHEKLTSESDKLKARAYEIQQKNAEKAGNVAAKEAERQNKELIKLAQAELKASNPGASNQELLDLATAKLKDQLKDPNKAAQEARDKALQEASDAYKGVGAIRDPVTNEILATASTGANKRVLSPLQRDEYGQPMLEGVRKSAALDVQKTADKNAAYAYALAERENQKAVQDLAKVYGQQQMSMSREHIISELKQSGKWIDPVQAAKRAKDETLLSNKAIDVSTSFSPELNKNVITASSGDEELIRKILPDFKFTTQQYQNPELGIRDIEAFRNTVSSLTKKDPMIDFRSTQELNKLSSGVKDTYNQMLGEETAKAALATDRQVRKSLAELGVDSLITDSGIENKVDLRDKLSKIMAQANTAKGGAEAVKVENAFKGLQDIYKNDPVKLAEVTAAFDKVKDKMRQAYLSDVTTGHNTFAIDPTSINWTMTAGGKIGMAANEAGLIINKVANSSPGQIMGQAKRFLDKGYKSYSSAFEKMSMATPEKRRAMMYVLLQQPEFRQAFGLDLREQMGLGGEDGQ